MCIVSLEIFIQNSINKKTSDQKNLNNKYGLFLSGGMDTRTILVAFQDISQLTHPI